MEPKMSQYTPQQLDIIFARTTRPLNAPLAAPHPRDAAVDEHGNVIARSRYGDFKSSYGWEVDHRVPKALGGLDVLTNLRALSCPANRRMGGIIGNALNALR
jgi:hypothetical protein